MDYMKDFLAQLQDGTSVEELAGKLTCALNEANRKFQEAEDEKKTARKAKCVAIRNMLKSFDAVLAVFGVDESVEATATDEEIEELVDEIDALIPVIQKMGDIEELLREAPFKEKFNQNVLKEDLRKNEDPIEAFLNQFVR